MVGPQPTPQTLALSRILSKKWKRSCKFQSFRNRHVIDSQGRADRALEFGDGFVEVGAGLEFAAAGRREIGLPLEDKIPLTFIRLVGSSLVRYVHPL